MAEDNKEGQGKDFQHLVRIANTDLQGNKQIGIALRKIKGIDFMFSNAVCSSVGLDRTKKTGSLTREEVENLDKVIRDPSGSNIPSWILNRRKDYEDNTDKHLLTSDLDFTKENDIKMMRKMKCYKGIRHSAGLPTRGQKTKANFRRSKGKVTGVKRKTK